MNISSARIPVTPSVFPRRISLLPPGSNYRLLLKQITYTTSVRIFSAGTIVSARGFYGFPSRKGTQQHTQQRRLADFGSEPSDSNYYRRPPMHITFSSYLCFP